MELLKILLLIEVLFQVTCEINGCILMWNSDTNTRPQDLCPVKTISGEFCAFPFSYLNKTFSTCIITGPNNPSQLPQCITSSGSWSICSVPTTAVINYVTTKTDGSSAQNGGSTRGGTLVWINGKRFAKNTFSTSPTSSTSNQVILKSEYASYACELHTDKTTETQITCYTEAMPEGIYTILVFVSGIKIPYYQYADISTAVVKTSAASTPFISSISPTRGLPSSFVTLRGNFKTQCYGRDVDECSTVGIPRITRVFFGPQLCDFINQTSNTVYYVNFTRLDCKLSGSTVALFNTSMLVSEDYGRAQLAGDLYYVTPNEVIYNHQTYAEIDSIFPSVGSNEGGTDLTITGKFLYHSNTIPSHVTVGTKKCIIKGFDNSDQLKSIISCQTEKDTANMSEYIGNRGIVITRDNVYTSFSNLDTVIPSISASVSWNDEASYADDKFQDVTIWMTGFLTPGLSSNYEFSIESNGVTKLYLSEDSTKANRKQVAAYDLTTNSKSTVYLNASKIYYLSVISSRKSGNLKLSIKAKMFDSFLNSKVTDKIKTETQEVIISSTIVPESFSISYNTNLSHANGSSEVQIIKVSSNNYDDMILNFDGANTKRISYGSNANQVKEALNDLPTLYGAYVDVNATSDGNGNLIYTIIFSRDHGDVPEITEVLGLVNFTNIEIVKGIASNKLIQIKIQNALTQFIDPIYDNSSEIQTKVKEIFGIRCPSSIIRSNLQTAVVFDYESECIPDEFPLDRTAFCGFCARKKKGELFKGLVLPLSYNQLCFAYKVLAIPLTKISYSIMIDGENIIWTSSQIKTVADNSWHYTCVDVYQDSLSSMRADSSTYPSSRFTLLSAHVYPVSSDLYFDAVSLKSKVPLGYGDVDYESSRRIIPLLQHVYSTLNVSRDTIKNELVLSYRPNNCTINLNKAKVRQNSAVNISSLTTSSDPVAGSFNLIWMNKTIGLIQADSSADYLRNLLQAVKGLENVDVTRTQDCAGFKWTIQWFYGGNKEQLHLSSISLNGNSPRISINTVTDGGIEYNPIPGDMLRTVSSKPQVSVMVNGIPSKCTSSCSFEYSLTATPIVDSILLNSSLIKITGNGFDDVNKANNLVFIGSTSCNVTLATSTNLTCIPCDGPVGTYSFKVQVLGKGYAIMNSNAQYTFSLRVDSFLPSIVGSGGGAEVKIIGSGFSNKSIVQIDNLECSVKSVTYNEITCLTTMNPTNTDKLANVVVIDGSSIATASSQLYIDNINIPKVTSISPSSGLSVLGGQTITIIGIGFNRSIQQITIGTKLALVQSINSTVISIKSPKMNPGQYHIIIPSGVLGNAKVTISLEYSFYVSSFTPSVGSIRGGTLITIYGEGFNKNCTLNHVSFGKTLCKVESCTTQWIQCKTSSAYNFYNINNTGINKNYGIGYQWSQSNLDINKGDTVQWTWSPPDSITNIQYMIEQVQDPASITPTGFSSGTPSSSGSFSYQFNSEGTYYYWSGYVDTSNLIELRGVINVFPAVDVLDKIIVTQGDSEAQSCVFPFTYNNKSYSTCTSVNFGFSWCSPSKVFSGQMIECNPKSQPIALLSCPGSTLNNSECTSSTTVKPNHMLFKSCNLPEITSISNLSGSLDDQIIIHGNGFSSILCENTVYIGDYKCPITQCSSVSLTCQIGSNSSLLASKCNRVEVNVANIGYAIQNNWYKFTYIPTISSITPSLGSQFGGTLITILGDGFDISNTVVLVDNKPMILSSIRYDQVTFVTQESSVGIKSLQLITNSINATCKVFGGCFYEFSSSVAPFITSITPMSVSGPTSLTINGTNFGSKLNELNVKIGSQVCTVNSLTSTSLTCSIFGLELGTHAIILIVETIGSASSSNSPTVSGIPSLISISPDSGSINGGTVVTIVGNGFEKTTQVTVGDQLCLIKSLNISQIQCLTQSGNGSVVVSIMTKNVQYPKINFTYDNLISSLVTSILPSRGSIGQVVTLIGTGFGINISAVSVDIGGSSCSITSLTNTQIICNTGSNIAGIYNVIVRVDNIGYSNSDLKFTYDLILSALSNSQGSFAGGLEVKLNGQGFDGTKSIVTVCSKACLVINATGTSQLTCKIPSRVYSLNDKTCDFAISVNNETSSLTFTYVSSLTPFMTNVSPTRGGTAGGTLIYITGSGFPSTQSDVTVTIAGSSCEINTINSTTISCYTGKYSKSSVKAPVLIFISNTGYALNQGNIQFEYIDLWSSVYTWGGQNVPQEGDLVLIGPGQTIYFDTITPVLKGIIIQGGSLIFDDNQNVNLNAEYIVISDNGKLQVGTETEPFKHRAIITMYGSLRSIELPIYGSKVIAVRNGTLDLHGQPVGVTWTYLAVTANSSTTTIQVKDSIDWPVGSKIVIATTGDLLSVGESEVRIIVSISSDKKTLTLDNPLKFTHLSETFTVGGVSVHKRAEVGLLSRNVIFNSINDNSWNSLRASNACPNGFDPGEFAVMTCFLGRYGDEIGSDEFGATIMLHSPVKNRFGAEVVIARISNVELTHVGQAFRIGRYPIHFHLAGDSPTSYVKECAIYESFNRAITIHGSNYIRIERTVIYNIMGGAFFLEDGVEHGNIYDGNLAVYVKMSSSGINEDGTPAAFWATNPNNTYINNAVAGGTHFGYWYRLLEKSEGPSYNQNYCPKKQPFGRFYNNTVHSCGRFGLWIFPSYTPTVTGGCSDPNPSVAKFEKFISYGCEKGAEWVKASPVQFDDFIVFDHTSAGIETQSIENHERINPENYFPLFFSESSGPLITNSVIIGNSDPLAKASKSYRGLVLAWDRGLLVNNVTFINFPDQNSHAIIATFIICICTEACGGWDVQFSGLKFINVKYRTVHRWNWDVVMKDLDGTLSGTPGALVLYNGNITSADTRCTASSIFDQGTVCQNRNHIRLAFNDLISENIIRIYTRNEKNITDEGFKYAKRLTHTKGFMMSLEVNQTYFIEFDQFNYLKNISYLAGFFSIQSGDWIIIEHEMNKKPDQVKFTTLLAKESSQPLTFLNNQNYDWFWDNNTRHLSYLICNKGSKQMIDYSVSFSAKKCRYEKCKMPEQPSQRLPATGRPTDALFWSNISTWNEYGFFGLPQENDVVVIQQHDYIVVDIKLPKLKRIKIDGFLEFDDTIDNILTADEIFINGGQLIIGWESDPFKHKAEIILTGTRANEELMLPNGFDNMGTKAIGVYGGLSLHGIPRKPSWTRLSQTATKGANTLSLVDSVDWQPNEEIVITTTSYDPWQTETFKIVAVSSNNKTITLNSTLSYTHIADSESYPNGLSYSVSAGVGLLTRNIKIIGGEYANQWQEKMGSRILVSDYSYYIYPDGSTVPTNIYYKGYARLSDVEFIHSGQNSRNFGDDYKAAILYSNLGPYDNKRPSYVRNCAFHNGFSGAIFITGSSSIPIENNVMHHTIDFAMKIEGDSNIIRKNLLALNVWASTYTPELAPFDINYIGAITITKSNSIVLEDNLITGSERVGLLFRGSPCSGLSLGLGLNHSINGNQIYGCLTGATILPFDAYKSLKCIRMSGFTLYKNGYWGLYYQEHANLIIEDNVFVDNRASTFTQVLGPLSKMHEFDNKYVTYQNNLFVGRSASFNCSTDVLPQTICILYSDKPFSPNTPSGGLIGIYGSSFTEGSNGAPFKPWIGSLTNNAIGGQVIIENTTFARYGIQCGQQIDAAITNSESNDDGQHPMLVRRVSMFNVENSSKIFFFRPNRNKINPSDCVDMDCDGMKKNLITDEDGSLLGTPGAVISQSEYGWNTQERGIGDYRVPLPVFAAPNGSMLPISSIYSKPGIVRDERLCSYRDDWQAYECHGLAYKMLVIESMDVDTETRRLSPVAILSDNKYIDLINGPQDHGRCNGYTCQRRLSTFLALVAANKGYDVYLSSTPPNILRFRILNASSDFKIRLSMHYFTSNNVNVYKASTLVDPTNADRNKNYLVLKDPNKSGINYMPNINDSCGTNFMSRQAQKLYFAIDGSSYVDLRISPEIFLTFGLRAQTEDSFFQSVNLLNNIALLLGIPSNKIRRVELVSAYNSTRVARQALNSIVYLQVVISDDPIINGNDTALYLSSTQALREIAANIINQAHIGFLQQKAKNFFNLSIESVAYDLTPSDVKLNSSVLNRQVAVEQIFKIITVQEFSGCRAQSPCDQQAIVVVQDKNGNIISNVGVSGFAWTIKATVFNSSSPTNVILQSEAQIIDGFAKFKKFGLSHSSASFSIKFSFGSITSLNETQLQPFSINSTMLVVNEPKLSGIALDSTVTVEVDQQFTLRFSIADQKSGIQIPNIAWNGLSWTSKLSMFSLSMWQIKGILNATNTQVLLDQSSGIATFKNLSIDQPGMYLVKSEIYSSDNSFNLITRSNIIRVVNSGQSVSTDTSSELSIKFVFEGNYDNLEASGELNAYKAMFYNYLIAKMKAIVESEIFIYKGSVAFEFDVDNKADVLSSLSKATNTTNSEILPGLTIKYVSIYGTTYNASGLQMESKFDQNSLTTDNISAIIGGTVGALAIVTLVGIGLSLLYKYKKSQNPRTFTITKRKEIDPLKEVFSVKTEKIKPQVKQYKQKRRLLNENVASEYLVDSETKFYSESITVTHDVPTTIKTALPNHLNLPMHSAASERLGPDDKESMIDVEVF